MNTLTEQRQALDDLEQLARINSGEEPGEFFMGVFVGALGAAMLIVTLFWYEAL